MVADHLDAGPGVTPKSFKLDLDELDRALSALQPVTRVNAKGGGRPAAYSREEVMKFYVARGRKITWAQINSVLPKPFKRPGTLAQSVHAAAERHGLPAMRSLRGPRKSKAAPAQNGAAG